MNRTLNIVLIVLAILVVAGGSFYGGMVYGKSQAQAVVPTMGQGPQFAVQGAPGAEPAGGRQLGGGRGGMLMGDIQAVSNGDLTITDQRGEQVTVHVTETTLIQKQASVTVDDLAPGDTVLISGSTGDDGSITARSVQVVTGGGFVVGGDGQPPAPADGTVTP